MINRINSPVLSITVTRNCNLDCQYCYFPNKGNKTISKDIVETVLIKHFDVFLTGLDETRILLSGGEPLLEKDLLFHVIDFSVKLGEKHNKKVSFTLDTNGVLLTNAIVNKLKAYNIYIMSSIDGNKELHDSQRPFLNSKQSSYDIISKNIDYALKELGTSNVAVRFTTTSKSVEELSKTFLHFYNLGFKIIDFAPNYEEEWTNIQLKKLSVEIARISDFIFINHINNKLLQNYFDYHLGKKSQISAYGHPCTIIPTVDTNGDIYACHRFIDNKDFLLGTYKNFGGVVFKIRKLSKSYIAFWENHKHFALGSCPANNVCKDCNPFELTKEFNKFINIFMEKTKETLYTKSNLITVSTLIEFEAINDDGDFILINNENGGYILLNETGFAIANILKKQKSMDLKTLLFEFKNLLEENNQNSEKEIFSDILFFLNELQNEKIIKINE